MAGSGFYLEVDATDLSDKISRLEAVLTPQRFNQVMYGIFRRTGGHVRSILKKDLPQEYNVRSGEVGSTVGGARVTSGVNGAGCAIPVVGPRKHIGGGGKGFAARGSRKGWASLTSGHYDVSAHIYKSSWGVLPAHMASYGGKPPFRNVPSKLGGLTFTREGNERLPIKPVYGIAIPQMPLNRSEPDVQQDIKEYMERRIEHEFNRLMSSI